MDPQPNKQDDASPAPPETTNQDEYTHTRKGKFRFKSSRSRTKHRHDDDPDSHSHRSHRHHTHHHRKRHRHRDEYNGHHHRRSSKRRSTSPHDQTNHGDNGGRGLSPNAAFRESLFDALGDDEGAAYWESIYGQPIHTYANPSIPRGPDGELEQMTEDEYAAYVRTRMWERTREGMLEAQEQLKAERREKEKRKKSEREFEEGRRERSRFERAMEESLRRGRERKRGRTWRGLGEGYLKRWEEVDGLRQSGGGDKGVKGFGELVFWPIESGKRRDVSREAVEEFLRHALVPASGFGEEDGLLAVLKSERVRWHPDKIQHRYGALGIDGAVIRSVTEVFQIVDRMWNEVKEKQG